MVSESTEPDHKNRSTASMRLPPDMALPRPRPRPRRSYCCRYYDTPSFAVACYIMLILASGWMWTKLLLAALQKDAVPLDSRHLPVEPFSLLRASNNNKFAIDEDDESIEANKIKSLDSSNKMILLNEAKTNKNLLVINEDKDNNRTFPFESDKISKSTGNKIIPNEDNASPAKPQNLREVKNDKILTNEAKNVTVLHSETQRNVKATNKKILILDGNESFPIETLHAADNNKTFISTLPFEPQKIINVNDNNETTVNEKKGYIGGPQKLKVANNNSIFKNQDDSPKMMNATSMIETILNKDEQIIHFVFGLWDDSTDNMPSKFRRNLQLWTSNNPGWKIQTWFGKEEIEDAVRSWANSSSGGDEVLQLSLEAWDVARPIQKADLFRYILLYKLGGLYFDLDVKCAGNNNATEFLHRVGLDPANHTAALFWEMGRKTVREQQKSAKVSFRRGVPEYRTRLSNYAIWSRPKSTMMACAIRLASYRIRRIVSQNLTLADRIPATLYSSGPDVVTECAFGVRDPDAPEELLTVEKDDEEKVVQSHVTNQRVLVVDPGPDLVNGNTFSWKNERAAR